jgi:hypothetical protein
MEEAEGDELGVRSAIAIEAGAIELVEGSEALSNALIDKVLAWPARTWLSSETECMLATFSRIVAIGCGGMSPGTFREIVESGLWLDEESDDGEESNVPPYLSTCAHVVRLARVMSAGTEQDVVTGWQDIVEVLREREPRSWAAVAIAVGATATAERGRPRVGGRLLDPELPLTVRTMDARARSGARAGRWWLEQFAESITESDRLLVTICGLLWTTGAALGAIVGDLSECVDQVSSPDFERLLKVVDFWASGTAARRSGLDRRELRALSPRVALVMHRLTPQEESAVIWSDRLSKYRGDDPVVRGRCAGLRLRHVRSLEDWKGALNAIQRAGLHFWGPRYLVAAMPKELAEVVVGRPSKYPLWVVEHAEQALSPEQTTAVGSVAWRDKWFAQ